MPKVTPFTLIAASAGSVSTTKVPVPKTSLGPMPSNAQSAIKSASTASARSGHLRFMRGFVRKEKERLCNAPRGLSYSQGQSLDWTLWSEGEESA